MDNLNCRELVLLILGLLLVPEISAPGAEPEEVVPVAGQPLAANVRRVLDSLEFIGAPLAPEVGRATRQAAETSDAAALQRALDPQVLFVVALNPESRVKVRRGPAPATLQQSGYTPVLIKIVNHSTVTRELHITSAQAGQVYAGMSPLSAQRMQRVELKETEAKTAAPDRFLEAEMLARPPLASELSGLEVEYAVALLYCRDAGRWEATIGFDVGQGTQDAGFRGEAPVLFEVRPAVRVKLKVRDTDGRPTTARFTFVDAAGHVFPPQAKRLAPDFYFQPQIYRSDGDELLLPPGRLRVEYGRGPEYRVLSRDLEVPAKARAGFEFRLERWIDPAQFGFYSGDHHIHGAGCAHYTSPTEGVTPRDMFRQVKGEALNVGCVLTWGPCFDYQRRFFSPGVDRLSEALTIMKYDLEISGFGSEALGHVCLLNLKDQTYPGSGGTKSQGWPTWTVPVLRWARQQGGVCGYAHSASGLEINARSAARRLLARFDADRDGILTRTEAAAALLPRPFAEADSDLDGVLTESELIASHERAAEELPNLAIPEMNGVGAMEIGVSVVAGVCDFISAMDTPRIAEWNMWYHLLNCGFPVKASGETDFPCMSGERVGQGRVYVQLGQRTRLDFGAWCQGLAAGKSYVSDGFAHAPLFTVQGVAPGSGDVKLDAPGEVEILARLAFAPATPRTVAQGLMETPGGHRLIGDTVSLHGPRRRDSVEGGQRLVEIVMNGVAVSSNHVAADGQLHEWRLRLPVPRSGWVALRQFPELHTNPVNVWVGGRPIRASRDSALWVRETILRLWEQRQSRISPMERADARRAYDTALLRFQEIAEQTAQ